MLALRSIMSAALALALFAAGCAARSPIPAKPSDVRPALATTAQHGALRVQTSGQGPSVILIPGLACAARVFDPLLPAMRRQFRVHQIDLPGFAGLPPAGGPPLATARLDLISYIRSLKDRPVALVGHSIGAFVAYGVAADRPDLVRSLVAIDGVPYLPALFAPDATPASMRAMAEQTRDQFAAMSPAQLRQALASTLTMWIPDAQKREAVLGDAARSHPGAVGMAQFEAYTTDLRQAVARITAPVLLLVGTRDLPFYMDRAVVARAYEAQLARVPSHKVEWLPQAGHFAFLDQPAEVERKIADFLHSAGASSHSATATPR